MAGLAREITDELLVAERHRRTSVEIAPLAPAVGDPAMIQQIWINLLSNALKFTSNTANVFISVGSKTGEGQNTYWIKDNGVGFDPKYAHRLFQVFQRLHSSSEFEGTGVGLAIVQRIVQKHGGRVWAESLPGEGATFYFTLPAGPAAFGGKP
jgi:light-regulated signal transduction histidine kinase (bacteriophytochrome)